MIDDENLYEDDDEEEGENFSGFSIVDESGVEITELKKTLEKIEEDFEETIATPIPQNEQTVILSAASEILPAEGTVLELKISGDEGAVYYDNEKIGEFKPAFIQRLFETRSGQFACCVMYSAQLPVMVKLLFSEKAEKGYIKIAKP